MRSAFRLLKPASYIAPFSPTGLTGVLAHPAPRPALIAIYNTTLTFLDLLPSHSVYRTSTATLTKHRLSIVNSVTPLNYQSYYDRNIAPLLPNLKKLAKDAGWPETKLQAAIAAAQVRAKHRELTASVPENAEGVDLETLNFISEIFVEEEKALADAVSPLTNSGNTADTGKQAGKLAIPPLPAEPALTSEQVAELEAKLEAGLIEEVLNQGIAEMRLVKELLEYQPWEQLEEEPVQGQWDYFSRKGPVQAA